MLNLKTNHRTPKFRLDVITKDDDEIDISETISDRLISLTLTDNRGFEADMLDLQLSDHDGKLAIPPRNAILVVAIGWKGAQLVDKGRYSVDEIQYSGAPDTLTLRARAADLKGSLSEQKERSFHNIKLGALIEQIATENQIGFECDERLVDVPIDHLDQTNESDANLLTRLAEELDCLATVKNGNLLFMRMGQGRTLSGKMIPPVHIKKIHGDSYNFSINETENYTAVRAYWHDTDTGKRGEITIDEHSKIVKKARMTKGRKLKDGTVKGARLSKRKYNTLEQTEPVETDSDKIKNLRETFSTEARALNAAKAAFDRLKRGTASFSMTLANGVPDLIPETPVQLSGFKAGIDSTEWLITRVTHNISDGGYTTQVECELKVKIDEEELEVKQEKK